jgi:hypothetical protein
MKVGEKACAQGEREEEREEEHALVHDGQRRPREAWTCFWQREGRTREPRFFFRVR